MAIELKVPEVGESITEVMIGVWKKNVGDSVSTDETVVEIESDKATVELPSPSNGVVSTILKQAGEQAVVGEVIGYLEAVSSSQPAPATPPESPVPHSRNLSMSVIASVVLLSDLYSQLPVLDLSCQPQQEF